MRRRSLSSWCALALAVSACRSAELPAPRPVLPAPRASAGAVVAESAAPAPAPISSLVALTTPVCSVASPKWSGELRLRAGGPPYAYVSNGPATISLGGAAHDGVSQAAVESTGLRVRGVVDQPNLYLARPTVLSRLVVPHASTPVTWHETTTPDHVLVSLDVSELFEIPKAAEVAVGCDALTGTEPSFDARAFAAPPSRRFASLTGESTLVAFLGERNGARLKLASTRRVEVVDTRGDMTRIVIDNQRYLVVGWLPSVMLGESRVTRPPRVRMGATSYRRVGDQHCAHDIALIASVAGERAFIGALPAGSSFTASTLDVESGFVELALVEPWFRVSDDAKLLARADDLSGC